MVRLLRYVDIIYLCIITMEDQQEIMLSLLKGSSASERTFQQLK